MHKAHANRLVTIVVRHNGEYRVSTPAGLEIKTGAIPLEYLQQNKINAQVMGLNAQPDRDDDPMSDLRDLDI